MIRRRQRAMAASPRRLLVLTPARLPARALGRARPPQLQRARDRRGWRSGRELVEEVQQVRLDRGLATNSAARFAVGEPRATRRGLQFARRRPAAPRASRAPPRRRSPCRPRPARMAEERDRRRRRLEEYPRRHGEHRRHVGSDWRWWHVTRHHARGGQRDGLWPSMPACAGPSGASGAARRPRHRLVAHATAATTRIGWVGACRRAGAHHRVIVARSTRCASRLSSAGDTGDGAAATGTGVPLRTAASGAARPRGDARHDEVPGRGRGVAVGAAGTAPSSSIPARWQRLAARRNARARRACLRTLTSASRTVRSTSAPRLHDDHGSPASSRWAAAGLARPGRQTSSGPAPGDGLLRGMAIGLGRGGFDEATRLAQALPRGRARDRGPAWRGLRRASIDASPASDSAARSWARLSWMASATRSRSRCAPRRAHARHVPRASRPGHRPGSARGARRVAPRPRLRQPPAPRPARRRAARPARAGLRRPRRWPTRRPRPRARPGQRGARTPGAVPRRGPGATRAGT